MLSTSSSLKVASDFAVEPLDVAPKLVAEERVESGRASWNVLMAEPGSTRSREVDSPEFAVVERMDGNAVVVPGSAERDGAEMRLRGFEMPKSRAPGSEFLYTLARETAMGSLAVGLAAFMCMISGVEGSSRFACSMGRQAVGGGP